MQEQQECDIRQIAAEEDAVEAERLVHLPVPEREEPLLHDVVEVLPLVHGEQQLVREAVLFDISAARDEIIYVTADDEAAQEAAADHQ